MHSISDFKHVVLWGGGNGALFKYLIKHYGSNVVSIIDSDNNKWNESVTMGNGKTVLISNPDTLDEFDKNSTEVIITTYWYLDEIGEALDKKGWADKWLTARYDLKETNSFDFKLFESEIDINHLVPRQLNIEITSYCNCKCVYCPFHGIQNLKKGNKGLMTWETVRAVVNKCKDIDTLTSMSISIESEVFTHPEWDAIMQYIIDHTNIKDVHLYTNGMLLNENNIEKLLKIKDADIRVTISIDGKTPEENDRYRVGESYGVVKNNINLLLQKIENKNGIDVLITNNYPVSRDEVSQSEDGILPMEAQVPEYLEKDFPSVELTSHRTLIFKSKYREDDFGDLQYVEAKWPKGYNKRCTTLFTDLVVEWDGGIKMCTCGSACTEASIGNVLHDDLMKTWRYDERILNARNQIIAGDEAPKLCSGCGYIGIDSFYMMVE